MKKQNLLSTILKFSMLMILYLCMTGCWDVNIKTYMNKSFEDIYLLAKKSNSPFCIVLIDSCQELSREYSLHLCGDYRYLAKKSIYNFINIRTLKNEWYLKWLCPISMPLTCVFSSEGRLLDLIPGSDKESFLYVEKVLTTMTTTEYHWPNQFQMNKIAVLPFLNSILFNKRNLDRGVYIPDDIDRVIDSLSYPYSYYLKLTGALMIHDSIEAESAAKYLLNLKTPYIMDLYKNEFITANKVLNKDYEVDNDAVIQIENDSVNLFNCKINENFPVNINVYNVGCKPLIISKIHTSCSCIEELDKKDEIIINPKHSVVLKFNFNPDVKGDVYRSIYIASNAINMPIFHITIVATVV